MSETRIMYVVGRLHLGGSEKLASWLISGMHDRPGFSTSVVCLGPGGHHQEQLERRGYSVRVLGYEKNTSWKGLLTAYRIIRDLRRLFRQERVTIVHTYLFYTGILGRIAARLAGVPVIVHSFFFMQYKIQVLTERVMRWMTDQYVVDSFAVRDNVAVRSGLDPSDVRVVHNGIDFDALDAEPVGNLRSELGIESAERVIGIVAHLSAPKGQSPYLEAFSKVLPAHPETWLLLVGDGPRREALEREAEDLGVSHRVMFLGARSDLVAVLNALDILALPSTWEGFGIVQAEAMYFRVPVIGTDFGGAREVVRSGETGYLVPYGDVEQLADATRRLLEDDELRTEMGRAGREHVLRSFGKSRMLDEYEKIYRDLVAR